MCAQTDSSGHCSDYYFIKAGALLRAQACWDPSYRDTMAMEKLVADVKEYRETQKEMDCSFSKQAAVKCSSVFASLFAISQISQRYFTTLNSLPR